MIHPFLICLCLTAPTPSVNRWVKFLPISVATAVVITAITFFGIILWSCDQCSWGKYLMSSRSEDSRQLDIESMQYVPPARQLEYTMVE